MKLYRNSKREKIRESWYNRKYKSCIAKEMPKYSKKKMREIKKDYIKISILKSRKRQ